MSMRKFTIVVLTLQGNFLTFTVSKYEIIDGDFVEFVDERTGKRKRFHSSRCEINEVETDDKY